MLKVELEDIRLRQALRYFRTGSILGGTIRSGVSAVEVEVEIDSDEPPERIANLVRLASECCAAHGALAKPVEMTTTVKLNGEPIEQST
jgi:uncharacterized OsmC-like protein